MRQMGFYEAIATLKATSPLSHTKLITDLFFHHSPETRTPPSQHTSETASPQIFLCKSKDLPTPRRGIFLLALKKGGN